MENLKSDKPIVAIETVPECSPFYEDLRSRNHLLGETKRKLSIRLYKECGLQIESQQDEGTRITLVMPAFVDEKEVTFYVKIPRCDYG